MGTKWRARLSQSLLAGVVLVALVPAVSAAEEQANSAPPGVVPALQNWTGGTGRLVLSSGSRVVVPVGASAGLKDLAGQVAADVAAMTTLHPPVVIGTAAAGDIALRVDSQADFGSAKPQLRPEAYRLSVGTKVEIVGGSDKGAYYGSRSLLQAVVASPDHVSLPVGSAVDYPDYAVRGFMLDVGRRFFTPEYIQAQLRWMGWLKMNTLQIHLNDNGFASHYDNDYAKTPAAFRLASTNPAFAGLAAKDGLLYVVPFANYCHGQGLDGSYIFNSWAPHIFGGTNNLTAQDPNLLGAMPAVWNDQTWVDYTELQVHGLIEKSFAALAQKMWSPTAGGTDYAAFLAKVATVGQGPGTVYLPDTITRQVTPGDLAQGRSATASSSEVSTLGAANAVDGFETTRWASAYSDNQWLQVDLGSAKTFTSARLNWEGAYGKDYDIQTSNDGATWTTVAQRRGRTSAGLDTLTFPAAIARYVRMKGITRGTAYGYSLYSMQIHA
ncbi:discoidin domain-containing protein [Streptomyces sp. NBC_00250]|uniref:discoidin domain-containing protein n=1 Tax=Streptomyces sp. NBC_00250 TaxID=2903641 RepID=UPI002E2A0E9C|nr:discoidin domain-containing protein [Streptomyces sp. NBC_00250]